MALDDETSHTDQLIHAAWGSQGKFKRFHESLKQANLARPLTRQDAQDLVAATSSSNALLAPCAAIEEELDAIVASIGTDISALCAEPGSEVK